MKFLPGTNYSFGLLLFAFCLAVPAGRPSASELPDLGEAARATVSEASEARLGREIMRQIRGDKDFLDDPEITDYLNALGERLAAASPSPGRQFEFFAVRDPLINAFALPGGFIGVHTGLISAAGDESELAGVLAHEIAHVTQNHIARIVDSQKGSALTTLAALAVAILASRSDNAQLAQAAVTTAQALAMQSQLDYTRDHEREADRVGLQTLGSAGYAPAGMVSFFERLQTQGRLYENKAPAYLRTHPLTHDRMADLQNRLAETAYRQHLDSIEFALVRAKVKAAEGDAGDALKRFAALAELHDDPSALYALTASALRAGDRARARETFTRLEKKIASPMVESLGIQVLLENAQADLALTRSQNALSRYPAYKPLAYVHARLLLRLGKATDARAFVTRQLGLWPEEPRLYRLLAEVNLALGRRAEGHLAQAEAHLRQDQPSLAMEQLLLVRSVGDGDFYALSVADARLRELRQRELEEQKAKP